MRQPPYLTFWALWFAIMAGYGVVWAAVIYVWGEWDMLFTIGFPLYGGLWLGVLQGLLLRHYFGARGWWLWIITSNLGWFTALLILGIGGGITLAGGGLNPETDIKGCLVTVCGLAGAMFGMGQAIQFRISPVRFDIAFWTITNAFAWAISALIGGIVGFAILGSITMGKYVDSHSPEYSLSLASGVLAAMLVIGAVTGAGAVWQVWLRSRPLEASPNL